MGTTAPLACSSPAIPSAIYCLADGGFVPACGVDGLTYENDSHAVCAGVAVAHEGACSDGSTSDAEVDVIAAVPDAGGEAGGGTVEAAVGAP